MKPEYQAWIRAVEAKYGGPERTLGRCQEEARAMAAEFPGLEVVRGHVLTAEWGRRGHWWCEDEEGEILDPTRGQFPTPFLTYEPHEEGADVRLGKCMQCGEEIWGPEELGRVTFCDASCYKAFGKELGG